MTALSEALAAAQAKALAALEKSYVRGTIDTDELAAGMDAIGCTDKADQLLLVESLDTLKDHGASEPAYTERRTTEKPTTAQASYIADLADKAGFTAPDMAGVTRDQAGEIIDSLKNGTYDQAKWEVPF